MEAIKAGTEVLYVPHFDHHADAHVGPALWEFRHVKAGRTGSPKAMTHHNEGDVADMSKVGKFRERDDHGNIHTEGGHILKPHRPLRLWPAVIVADNGDGTARLQIDHPHGHKLDYPRVPHDGGKGLHTFHLAE